MKKDDVLNKLEKAKKDANLYPFNYWLGANTSLLFMGIIDDVKNINIYCDTDTFFGLSLKYGVRGILNRYTIINDNIIVHENNYRPKLVVIDGYCCETIMRIKKHYEYHDNKSPIIAQIDEFLIHNGDKKEDTKCI